MPKKWRFNMSQLGGLVHWPGFSSEPVIIAKIGGTVILTADPNGDLILFTDQDPNCTDPNHKWEAIDE